MLAYVCGYSITLTVLVVGDAAWLSYFAPAVFRPALGDILLEHPRWIAAAIFYLSYALGVTIFPVATATRQDSCWAALIHGALFGLFAYMTYDLTNLATIRVWTLRLALMDMAWGTVLTGVAALAGFAVIRKMSAVTA